MLKGIDPLLGPELLMILRAMGHGDEIAIVDGNYPADAHASNNGARIVRMDGHSATKIVDAILSLMPLDTMVDDCVFRPGIRNDPAHKEPVMDDFAALVEKHVPGTKITPLMGDEFYARVGQAYALVASGERRLYGNLVLRKGVIGPEEA